MSEKQHVVVTVMGKDRVGIVAAVSKALSDNKVNIVDISQTLLQDIFAMILLVDIANSTTDLLTLSEIMKKTGSELGLNIMIQHEDIFRYMHRI